MTPLRFALLPVLVVALAALAADEPEKPKDVGLSERTSTTLAQIDVTVSGPKDAIEGLTAALKDASASVRQQAAFALGQIRY